MKKKCANCGNCGKNLFEINPISMETIFFASLIGAQAEKSGFVCRKGFARTGEFRVYVFCTEACAKSHDNKHPLSDEMPAPRKDQISRIIESYDETEMIRNVVGRKTSVPFGHPELRKTETREGLEDMPFKYTTRFESSEDVIHIESNAVPDTRGILGCGKQTTWVDTRWEARLRLYKYLKSKV